MTDESKSDATTLVARLRSEAETGASALPIEAAAAIEDLTAALIKALPFVEDVLTSTEFKPGYVPKTVDHIRVIITKYGASNG